MTVEYVNEYLNDHFESIKGWCTPHLWHTIQAIHELQERLDVKKPIAEIGVYHGKFFIGLSLTKRGYGKHHAFDVFDLQQFNLDGAGAGNLESFLSNLEKVGLSQDELNIIRVDSMALTQGEVMDVRSATGGFSMFSVDGCHTIEHTMNDFTVAMDMTCAEGVIFVDDYNNSDWPGVQEGMSKLYQSGSPRFVPLAFTCNKLVTCHISYHSRFIEHLKEFLKQNFPNVRTKLVKRFGYDCINVHPKFNEKNYCAI
jgi:hypothetical protein